MTARRVLLIEDDAKFANALSELVSREGHEPMIAAHGDLGFEMTRQITPDVVLLDLHVPGIDGWALLDRLKHETTTRGVPVCMLTGDPRRLRALRLGAFAYLQKPVSNESVAALLNEVDDFLTRARKRVLVVDADDARRDETITALRADDIEFTEATSPLAAAEIAAAQTFDCHVISPAEGDTAWAEILQSIAARESPRNTPILVRDLHRNRLEVPQHLAGNSIVKPFRTLDDLFEEVSLALHRSDRASHVASGPDRRRFDSALAGKRVLIVDDDARNALAMTALLEPQRMQIVVAKSGDAALELLRGGAEFDVVLMDIMMPGLDGYDTIRTMRTMSGYLSTPVVAVTARAMKGDRDACLAAGASDFVPKPVDASELFSVMRVLFSG